MRQTDVYVDLEGRSLPLTGLDAEERRLVARLALTDGIDSRHQGRGWHSLTESTRATFSWPSAPSGSVEPTLSPTPEDLLLANALPPDLPADTDSQDIRTPIRKDSG